MADNQQEPTPAEVYANIRDKALEEAAQEANSYADRCAANQYIAGSLAAKDIVGYIRALKRSA